VTVAKKSRRHVRWEMEVLPWAMVAGLALGFAVELYTHIINVIWMTGGSLLGGIVGAICDTALFIYRRIRQQRTQSSTTEGHA
jgi:hypothetical protein